MADTILTQRQKRFADYFIETGNATQAAKKAGYKQPGVQGCKILKKPSVKAYVDERLKVIESDRIACAAEVMKYLTSVMRGEHEEEVIVVENVGDYCSQARSIKKQVGAKERIKAAELLGKRYSLFADKLSVDSAIPVVICGEDKIED